MTLWLLCPLHEHEAPWHPPPYDKLYGVVVRAETADRARELAAGASGDEGRHAWFDASLTFCVQLHPDGAEGVILTDYLNG